ncbi:MAG: DUF6783 domain-containing protein [Blautia obeum]
MFLIYSSSFLERDEKIIPTNCDIHLAKSIFQTRSNLPHILSALSYQINYPDASTQALCPASTLPLTALAFDGIIPSWIPSHHFTIFS